MLEGDGVSGLATKKKSFQHLIQNICAYPTCVRETLKTKNWTKKQNIFWPWVFYPGCFCICCHMNSMYKWSHSSHSKKRNDLNDLDPKSFQVIPKTEWLKQCLDGKPKLVQSWPTRNEPLKNVGFDAYKLCMEWPQKALQGVFAERVQMAEISILVDMAFQGGPNRIWYRAQQTR